MSAPAIIEVALNGVTTKAANPHVPRSPAEITADALACIAAGATIVHNHNDEPMWVEDGVHSAVPYLKAWRPILAAHPDVQLYATQASGGPGIAISARWAHQEALARAGLLRVGLIDPGSVNLGDRVYVNARPDALYAAERCRVLGLTASVSIFDPSFLRAALALPLPPGTMIKLYFGGDALPFGLPPTEPSLDAYQAMLDGTGLQWLVAVLGGDVLECGLAELALERGGHVRVGLEDYAGDRTPTNVELVEEAAAAIVSAGRRVSTTAQTRASLRT
jgi:uncharacterized protein (DUF849 family)